MSRTRSTQRGEGKIGCIVSLLVLILLVATGFKVVPVLYSNHEFVKVSEEIAGRAALLTQQNIELQIREKAQDLGIREALEPGAIVVTRTAGSGNGVCTVRLTYTREVDLFGVTSFEIKTNKEKVVPYMDVR